MQVWQERQEELLQENESLGSGELLHEIHPVEALEDAEDDTTVSSMEYDQDESTYSEVSMKTKRDLSSLFLFKSYL